MSRVAEQVSHLTHTPSWGLLSHGLFSATSVTFLFFLLVISWFKIDPRHGADVLSSVPKCKRAMARLTENVHLLGKPPSGRGDSAAGGEFSVNESTIYSCVSMLNKESFNRNTHKTMLCTNYRKPALCFLLGAMVQDRLKVYPDCRTLTTANTRMDRVPTRYSQAPPSHRSVNAYILSACDRAQGILNRRRNAFLTPIGALTSLKQHRARHTFGETKRSISNSYLFLSLIPPTVSDIRNVHGQKKNDHRSSTWCTVWVNGSWSIFFFLR